MSDDLSKMSLEQLLTRRGRLKHRINKCQSKIVISQMHLESAIAEDRMVTEAIEDKLVAAQDVLAQQDAKPGDVRIEVPTGDLAMTGTKPA